MRHRIIGRRTLAATVGALALTATIVSVPLSSASGQPTVLHTYTAFEHGKLAPGLIVRATVRGSCWTLSAVESRPYTWRCQHGNHIDDPCFSATPTSKRSPAPTHHGATGPLLRLTKPLPHWHTYTPTISDAAWPWGIVTLGGKHCTSTAPAATGEINGKQITYVCQDGGAARGLHPPHHPSLDDLVRNRLEREAAALASIADAWLH